MSSKNTNYKVLVVEDDPVMLRGLKDNLEYEGYEVIAATDGEAGLEAALDKRPDLILLDIMLPKINGFEICRILRKEKLEMPIIMLTAKGQESDIVLGLETGADDYVTKPFSIKELLARAAAQLRRNTAGQSKVIEFGTCRVDMSSRTVCSGGRELGLTPKEFRLLEMLVRRPERAFTRAEILNQVWGYNCFVSERTIDRFVTTLRNKIEPDPHNPKFIQTVREVGYRFSMGNSEVSG